ncbi:MAG: HAMP domain-containing protein [Pseudomonadaceae bacterium]|nr:MAG: HAMP domain-containing protein [Pseudomonadaceae bacterium]
MSLTLRIGLAFMLAATAVIFLTATGFYLLSKHHFEELDQHTLQEKIHSIHSLLEFYPGSAELENLRPQLHAMLGAHETLRAVILGADERILFAEPPDADLPPSYPPDNHDEHWTWQEENSFFRGAMTRAEVADETLTVVLALDITTHTLFFRSLLHWLWAGLLLCALASAALGWLVARSGLQPLRKITRRVASMSARSLSERMDISGVPAELVPMVNSFNAMLARLEDAFARMSNFSADIAHEMRTPVSNMMTQTEVVLTRERDMATYANNLHSNLEELKHLSRMIDDMLFLAKSDNGLTPVRPQTLALHDLITKQLDYYQILADDKEIAIELTGRGNIQGDPLLIARVISNLLSNALRYTPSGKTIRISLNSAQEGVQLTIANPGETIEPHHLSRLFDRFYRADSARHEGTPNNAGLGLAIAAAIVKAHNGRIWCTSADGQTCFHLEFPAIASR